MNSEVEKLNEWNEKWHIRMCQAEERICEIDDGNFEIIQRKTKSEKE